MTTPDANFEVLEYAISVYLNWMQKPFDYYRPVEALTSALIEFLPFLAEALEAGAPDRIYAKQIIEFAINGLNNEVATAIWDECYVWPGTIKDVARKINRSPRTVSRYKEALPRRIASQLWLKNAELDPQQTASSLIPLTLEQRRIEILRSAFNLTNKQALVVLAWCSGSNDAPVGRREIANRLAISLNTLKSHSRKILRKTNTDSMNSAAMVAKDVLNENPDAEWGN